MFFSRPASITVRAIISVLVSIFVYIYLYNYLLCRYFYNYLCTCHHKCLHNNLYVYFYISNFGSPNNLLFYSHLCSSLMTYLYYKTGLYCMVYPCYSHSYNCNYSYDYISSGFSLVFLGLVFWISSFHFFYTTSLTDSFIHLFRNGIIVNFFLVLCIRD